MKNVPEEISLELQDAILNRPSSTMVVRATIDPSRTFFKQPDSSNSYNGSSPTYDTPSDDPVGQCMFYSSSMDKVYTFIIDKDSGVIYGMESGYSTKNNTGLSADPDTKPSVFDIGNGTARLYYWDGALKYSTINLSNFTPSGTTAFSAPSSPYWTISSGSPTVLSKSDINQLLLCYKTSLGGTSIAYYDGSTWRMWEGRFMSANCLTDAAWTIYTTGTVFNGKLYVYSTDVDTGVVNAIEYNPYSKTWSDVYVALPADFSRFDISNAIVANGYVHLAGQFHRTDDYSESRVYSLVLRSPDGKSFSWDKFTLLSETGFRFGIDIDTTNKLVYASDRNSIGVADMSYYFTSVPSGRIVLPDPYDEQGKKPIISFSANSQGATLKISAADEEYALHPTVKRDNRVKVEVGYITENGPEYQLYGTYIIDGLNYRRQDAGRKLVLSLVSEGVWKTDKIAFPFYAEILSKSSIYDNCDAQDKMYVQPCVSIDQLEYLTIDFWHSEKWETTEVSGAEQSWYNYWLHDGERTLDFTGTVKGKTINLNEHPLMTSYPTVTGDITIKFYGWEDDEGTSRNNSTFNIYAVTAPENDLTDITVTTGSATTAQTFPERGTGGAYPMGFTFTGIDTGDKLLYFGVTATNNNAGTCYIYLERIEVWAGIQFAYTSMTSSTTWSLETPPDESRDYLVSPDTGLQNIMFTTKPYSAFNFNVAAEFGYDGGDYPLSPGTTAWGVLGMAKDGYDFICARYKRQNSKIELCLFRDGEITILDSYTTSEVYDLMLDHRHGILRVWYKSTDTWTGPVIKHHYDEITYGVISTSDTGIMHTGIYSAVYPPSLIISAFAAPYSYGICLTKDQTIDSLVNFPDSGYVTIDGQKYSYTGKAINTSLEHYETYGPYQLRQVSNVGGMGLECALFKPENSESLLANLLIGQENHHTWRLTSSDWTVEHSTGGVPDILNNRSRHFTPDGINDQYYEASLNDRVYLNHGLLGVELEDDTSYYHSNGALCFVWSTDKIWVEKVVATQIDHDATVEDMLRYLCNSASISAEFPGNWTTDTLTLSGTPITLAEEHTLFPGGFDMRFLARFNDQDYVEIHPTNLELVTNPGEDDETKETITFGFKRDGSKIYVYMDFSGTTSSEKIATDLDGSDPSGKEFRLLIHDDFVSFYGENMCLATFALGAENLEWDESSLNVEISANGAMNINNVIVSELFDWREAIYIESELSVSSAIGSVVQERPIDIYTTADGNLSFSYFFERDVVPYSVQQSHRILEYHDEAMTNVPSAGSDALVYYADVTFTNYTPYANSDGFNTRVFRLSSLDTGAKLAAKILLEKAYQKQNMHQFKIRPDLRLEIGDVVDFSYMISGTETVYNARGIIENMSINIQEGDHSMQISCRSRDTEPRTVVNCYTIGAT